MRLALLIALSADRRTARALGDPMPYDAALKSLRDFTPANAPAPIVQVWAGNAAKEKVFRDVPSLGEPVPAGDELTAVLAANEAMQAQLAEATKELEKLRADYLVCVKSEADLRTENELASARVAEVESQLAEATKKRGK